MTWNKADTWSIYTLGLVFSMHCIPISQISIEPQRRTITFYAHSHIITLSSRFYIGPHLYIRFEWRGKKTLETRMICASFRGTNGSEPNIIRARCEMSPHMNSYCYYNPLCRLFVLSFHRPGNNALRIHTRCMFRNTTFHVLFRQPTQKTAKQRRKRAFFSLANKGRSRFVPNLLEVRPVFA